MAAVCRSLCHKDYRKIIIALCSMAPERLYSFRYIMVRFRKMITGKKAQAIVNVTNRYNVGSVSS